MQLSDNDEPSLWGPMSDLTSLLSSTIRILRAKTNMSNNNVKLLRRSRNQ